MIDYHHKFLKYKHKYLQLKYNQTEPTNNQSEHDDYLTKQSGGAMNNKWQLFNQKEHDAILKDFDMITQSKKPCGKFSKKIIRNASKGMYLADDDENDTKKICRSIYNAYEENHYPIVHEDSLTAWINRAAEQYGLNIGDILKMKPGDQIDVIFFDRNVGDYMHGTKAGTKYDPRKKGCTYGTYIHGDDLSGSLKLKGEKCYEDFEWEINLAALGSKLFWGPLFAYEHAIKKEYSDLNPKIKVGWRGPAIRVSEANFLPEKVTHYDTWFDDFAPYQYKIFLKKI